MSRPAAVSSGHVPGPADRYRALFDSIDQGFCIVEVRFDETNRPLDYRFLEVNAAFERQTGLVDAVGQWMRRLRPTHEEHWFDVYGKVALTGESVRFQSRADALRRWYDVYAFRIDAPSDRHVAMLFNDITDRRQSEEALRRRTAEFEALLDSAPMGVLLVGADQRIAEINPAAAWAFGESSDLTGRRFDDVMRLVWTERFADQIIERFCRTLADGTPYVAPEDMVQRKDRGGREAYEWHMHRIPLPDGTQGVVCYFRDITAHVRAREALKASEERVRVAMKAGRVGIWDWDILADRVVASESLRGLYGVPEDRPMAAEDFFGFVHLEDRNRLAEAARDSLGLDAPYELEFRAVRPDGRVVWLFTNAVVVREEGRAVRMLGATVDITERKRAEERLRSWNVELERRVNERTEKLQRSKERLRAFATELSLAEERERKRLATELHDYLAQLLVLAKLQVGQAGRAEFLPAASRDLVAQAEDVLSQALTYTRTLVADLSPPVLRQFGLPAALAWLGRQMKRHGLTVHVDTGEHERLPVKEDQAVLLFQSVRELLMNVSKHTDKGEASVRLFVDDGTLRIVVRDEGPGFDVAASGWDAPAAGGSHFGLFSIRERMTACGGSFRIESAPGKGTTATLELPLEEEVASAEVTVPGSQGPEQDRGHVKGSTANMEAPDRQEEGVPIRVLLVDDHAMVRRGLRTVLEEYSDVQVVGEASDGEEAVRLVEQRSPTVVVMDVNMPRLGGIEATERIHARHPAVAVIGLSVEAGFDVRTAMLRAGALDLLTKEAAVEELHRAVTRACERARRGASRR